MNELQDDYLWDPHSKPDPVVVQMERALAPVSSRALNLADRALPLLPPSVIAKRRRHRNGWLIAAAAAAALVFIVAALLTHRLSWSEASPWRVVRMIDGSAREDLLRIGSTLATTELESATLDVARIGTVELAPNSAATLIETRDRQHRIELKHGHLHAKIWAPPGYFGVMNRGSLALDLGCEFELEATALGNGRLNVISGWVIYNRGGTETLIPEGHTVAFDDTRVGMPTRNAGNVPFKEQIAELDVLLAQSASDEARIRVLTNQVAEIATDADYLTLLVLMTRHRQLTGTAIDTRLQKVLGDPGDGDRINEWWRRVPKPPKQWWRYWQDAL
jgi:hypothetical protein